VLVVAIDGSTAAGYKLYIVLLCGKPVAELRGVIWDHRVLRATRHRWSWAAR